MRATPLLMSKSRSWEVLEPRASLAGSRWSGAKVGVRIGARWLPQCDGENLVRDRRAAWRRQLDVNHCPLVDCAEVDAPESAGHPPSAGVEHSDDGLGCQHAVGPGTYGLKLEPGCLVR